MVVEHASMAIYPVPDAFLWHLTGGDGLYFPHLPTPHRNENVSQTGGSNFIFDASDCKEKMNFPFYLACLFEHRAWRVSCLPQRTRCFSHLYGHTFKMMDR